MRNNAIILIAMFLAACGQDKPHLKTRYNTAATPVQTEALQALNGFVINSFVDTKKHTTSTLYGNTVVANYLKDSTDNNYPKGSVVTLLTWQQTSDPRWFGGNIPDSLVSMEVVRYDDSTTYTFYKGKNLTRSVNSNAPASLAWIKAQKMMIVPR
ncbi:hypothetical protein SAMN04488109_6303 [Chryseolinea serpens]|uniref:Cytochrome P460 n=1 Tax=Chryseolinea serpens TaxID=947013 RepID=A0A1M5XA14_9BACT|nr:hypothetical protein [Chryseolinea serpens]SHH96695.1 hypothetical protein SAMN04488109_6303 [Chryseolinea serpens]